MLTTGSDSTLSLLSAHLCSAKAHRTPLLHPTHSAFSSPGPLLPFKTPRAPMEGQEWEVSPGKLGYPSVQERESGASGLLAFYLTQACFFSSAVCLSGCHEQNGYCSKPAECM